MKKTRRKLSLRRETVRTLSPSQLTEAHGRRPINITETCENSGCYVCSGGTCTFGCTPSIEVGF